MKKSDYSVNKFIYNILLIFIISICMEGCKKLPEGGYIGTYYMSFEYPKDSMHKIMFTEHANISDISEDYVSINGSALNKNKKNITGNYYASSSMSGGYILVYIDAKWKKTNGKYHIGGSFTADYNYYTGGPLDQWEVVKGYGTFELVYE